MAAEGEHQHDVLTSAPNVTPVSAADSGALTDLGAVRNTAQQFAAQIAGFVCTGALTLYLVRALGPSGYGRYALAVSIASLLVLPAGLGIPMSVGRFVADHRADTAQLRAILGLGLRFQVPVAIVASLALFALAGPIARAYGIVGLEWPLRWAALSVAGQALFTFLTAVGSSVRQSQIGLWMAVTESVTETLASASLVVVGAGAAGAVLGKTIGYAIGASAGLYLTLRLLRRPRGRTVPRQVSIGAMMRYAGVLLAVDLGFSAMAQVDVLLIGALLSAAAVGAFSAVWRLLNVLFYLGLAVAAGVAPRLSLGSGSPDTRAFVQAIRFLIITQGLVIAPMLVWPGPIVALLFGSRYGGTVDDVMRALTVVAFLSPPAALMSQAVTYMGEARRRIVVVFGTLVLGTVAIYVLIRAIGLVGAAIGDDIITLVWVSAHLWICTRLITIDLRKLAVSFVRTLLAAAAMALALAAVGTSDLSAAQWIVGLGLGVLGYVGVLWITRELSADELRTVTATLRRRVGS